ncbi:MAG: Spy/CpxP family protein refolding chaperone [Sedimentisphaerales bacterium]|nr:Spy/CpxP family protein refolding chaperone [Sedimentisphaerales bacterium]
MKKTHLTIIMVLLLTAAQLYAGQCTGQGKGKRHRFGQSRPAGPRIGLILKSADELGLDPNQVDQLKTLADQSKDQLKAAGQTVKEKRDALNELVQAGAPEADIRAAAAAVGVALGDASVLKAEINAKVNAILTDEQKAKLEELKDEKMQGRKGRHGKGKGPMDPQAAFTAMDTDSNGVISLEEFKAHREQMKERFGRGHGKGPGCQLQPPPDEEGLPTDEPQE